MTDEAKSPLRRRMIEDITIRKLAKTRHDDVQRIKNFAAFLGRSPDTADFESPSGFEEAVSAESVSQLRTSAYAIAKSEGQSPPHTRNDRYA